MTVRTAAIANLGCKVNQSEMAAAARLLRAGGVRLVDPHETADLYVVNTCTVTSIADQKSRQAVRRARRANPEAQILVTGCSVEVDRATFAEVDPRARLMGNAAKSSLLAELAALAEIDATDGWLERPLPTLSGVEAAVPADVASGATAGAIAASASAIATARTAHALVASIGATARTAAAPVEGIGDDRTIADRTRAFIKVQDGCSFYCTYCIIPRARGPERSVPPELVLADVRRAIAAGHREIVLTGINVGTYDGGWSERGRRGAHTRAALSLAGLVRRILWETTIERVRLSSIEPQHVDDELLEAWSAGAPRTLPHFHLPLQSGDDGVLRRMGRRYDTATYASVVAAVRGAIPDVALHADVIAGFPSEDDAAWERSMAFIRSLEPAGLHVFRYSAREGTPATRMTGQLDERTKKERAAALLAFADEARARFAARHVGRYLDVLFESRLDDGRWVGRAPNNVLVAAAGDGSLDNVIARVSVNAVDPAAGDRVVGRVVGIVPSVSRALPVVKPSPGLGRALPLGEAHA